jgi:hypothetical protein
MTINLDDVRKRVAEVRELADDPEAAHSAEDALWESVLTAISNGVCDDEQACAKEALKTQRIKFARWCA